MKIRYHSSFLTLSCCALISVCASSVSAQVAKAKPVNITVKDYLGKERTILDSDGDGWDDLWCHLHRDLKHRNKAIDTDKDGLTDYEEMVMWRSPYTKGPLPREFAPEEIAAGKLAAAKSLANAQKAWQKKKAEAAPLLCQLILPGKTAPDALIQQANDETAELKRKASAAAVLKPQQDRALDGIAKKYKTPREKFDENGRKQQLVGEMGGMPLYIQSFDTLQSASISADELWPATAWPFSNNNTGLGLTGAGTTLGMWEVDGAINTTHTEFGSGRVVQKDTAVLDPKGHATQVAGAMAGAGAADLTFLPAAFSESRGVAYGANVFGYNTADIVSERLTAANGNTNDPPVHISNNSWGQPGPWEQFDNNPLPPEPAGVDTDGDGIFGEPNVDLRWKWTGITNPAFQEDFKFGFYFPTAAGTSGGVVNDTFMRSDAPRHLLVYACGNDRATGPQTAPSTYFIGTTEISSAAQPRVWRNGDEGGYDTVASPATAKNVLSVGSCEDIYLRVGNQTSAGYATGAVVVPSSFSGAGPTDDGRIKPDLVAVGSPSAIARTAFGFNFTPAGGTPTAVLVSPTNGAGSYRLGLQGTSFSAPTVTGMLGLVMERRNRLYPTLPATEAWQGSTLKAIAINSCDDVGTPGPDYRMGYGPANARQAVQAVTDEQANGRGSLIKELTLAPTTSVSWMVQSSGTAPLSVTAAWSDPAGPAPTVATTPESQAPMLVNNIDLRVEYLGPDVTTLLAPTAVVATFLPWTLNPDLGGETAALRSAAAVRGVDNRNNVEKVSVATPVAGRYRITLTHAGGLPDNPAPSTQVVSIVLSGVTSELPRINSLAVSPTATQYLLTFSADPGAYFTLQSSPDLMNWTDSGSVLAVNVTNTVLVNSAITNSKLFWRMRRGQ
jgi:hypothetical protein